MRMRKNTRFILFGGLAVAAWFMWRKRQAAEIMAGAAAAAASASNAPNVNVAPTAAATTQSMQALADIPTWSAGLGGPIDYEAFANPQRVGSYARRG
jgi:hypothetical protein